MCRGALIAKVMVFVLNDWSKFFLVRVVLSFIVLLNAM